MYLNVALEDMPVYLDDGILKIRPGSIVAFPRVYHLQRLSGFGLQLHAFISQILPGRGYHFFRYIIFQTIVQSFLSRNNTLTCTTLNKEGLHLRQAFFANFLFGGQIPAEMSDRQTVRKERRLFSPGFSDWCMRALRES